MIHYSIIHHIHHPVFPSKISPIANPNPSYILSIPQIMYRKYTPTRTQVLNAYNYLLDTQEIGNNQGGMFHQILISSESLPSLHDEKSVEMVISESENQNCVQEVKGRFQFYLEHSLLQIRLRPKLRPVCELSQLPVRNILKIIIALNLDFLISIKQIRSIVKHNQSNLNNGNKFYSQFLWKGVPEEMVLLFIDEERILYYDLYFQDLFCKNREPEKKIDERALRSRLSDKRVKRKSELAGENSDQLTFQKYIYFITLLLENANIVEMVQEVKKLAQMEEVKSQFYAKFEKVKGKLDQKTMKDLAELLRRCIADDREYNINIFCKQCELLLDKHEKMQKTLKDSDKSQNISLKEQKTKTSKSCLALKKEESFSIFTESRRPNRQKEQKLKNSKSMISLKFKSPAFPTSKNKSIKNPFGILSKTKEKLLDKTNIFLSSTTSLGKEKNRASVGSSQHMNTVYMNSATSNWFNQTISEKESIIKLRNFKKSNNFNMTASNTPNHKENAKQGTMGRSFYGNTEKARQEIERASEEQLNRLSKLMEGKSKKTIKEAEEKNDMFTMTEQVEEVVETQTDSQVRPSPVFKREIVNTLNFKYYEQIKKAEQEKKEEAKEPTIPKENKAKENVQQQISQTKKTMEEAVKKPTPSKQPQMERQFPKELTESKKIKESKQHNKRISQFDEQEIEEVSFMKKKALRIQENTSIMSKSSILHNTSIMQKKPKIDEEANKTTKAPQTNIQNRQKTTKIMINVLSQQQRSFYTAQFQSVLKFYKVNMNKWNLPPKLNINFIVNCLYFKSLLQFRNLQDKKGAKPLIDVISKKQEKIKQQYKNECLLYRVQFDSLWEKWQVVKRIDEKMREGIDEDDLRHMIHDAKEELDLFYILTCESNRLLELIFDELTTFVQTNKAALIQSNAFPQALQLIYLITLILIISLQRQNYYKFLFQGKYGKLQDCFKFKYEQSVDEYLQKYRKTLQNRNMASLSVKQESTFLKNWYDQYR